MNVLIIFLKGYICGLVYGDVIYVFSESFWKFYILIIFYWFFNFNLDFCLI